MFSQRGAQGPYYDDSESGGGVSFGGLLGGVLALIFGLLATGIFTGILFFISEFIKSIFSAEKSTAKVEKKKPEIQEASKTWRSKLN